MKAPKVSVHLKAALACVQVPTASTDCVDSTAVAGVRSSPVVLSIYDNLVRCQATCGDVAAQAYICERKRGSARVRDVTTQTYANMITEPEVRQMCELLSVQAQEKFDRMERQFTDLLHQLHQQQDVLRQQTQLIMQLRGKDSDDTGVSECFDELHFACLQPPHTRSQQPVIERTDIKPRTEMPALLEEEEAGEAMGITSGFLTPADMQALGAVSIMHRRGVEQSVQGS